VAIVPEENVNLFEQLLVIKKRIIIFISVFAVILFGGIIISLVSPAQYVSKTTFFFPNSSEATGVTALLKKQIGMSETGSIEGYSMAILKSQALADIIISKIGTDLFGKDINISKQRLYSKLKKMAKIKKNEDGIFEITVTTSKPELSARLAQCYIDEFKIFADNTMLNIDQLEVDYLKKQKDMVKTELSKMETKMLDFKKQKKIVDYTGEAQANVTNLINIKRQIIENEVQCSEFEATLSTMKEKMTQQAQLSHQDLKIPILNEDPVISTQYLSLTNAELDLANLKTTLSEQNPKVQIAQKRVDNIKEKIQKLISARLESLKSNLTDELITIESSLIAKKAQKKALEQIMENARKKVGQLPILEVEFKRLERDLKIKEDTYNFIELSLLRAKIKVIRSSLKIQVLDQARIPDYKAGPRHVLNAAISALLGLLAALCAAFLAEYLEKQKKLYLAKESATE
jgi:uncharacterized protein involved in exopolysaccharide biosynthesis